MDSNRYRCGRAVILADKILIRVIDLRMRKKKNGTVRLCRCDDVWIENPEEYKGRWSALFGNQNPIHVEIGCGKGSFITQLARENPDINFIAIEKLIDVLVLAAEKATGLANVRFILGDAAFLEQMLDTGEVQRIYINFCDPWHKNRHCKRRLTYSSFLDIYKNILCDGGSIIFKTDNKNLFEFSLNSFCDSGFRLKNITLDLHNSSIEGNIMTEYEKLFSENGFPIYRLEASCFAKK